MQVWTVEEGFGIGSQFRQTGCAANNFRVHEVLFRWFKLQSLTFWIVIHTGANARTLRTLAVSVGALRHFNLRSF